MKVVIMRGIPGSGKSTLAKNLVGELSTPVAGRTASRVQIFSADNFFCSGGCGEYRFDRSKLPEAHATCLREFTQALIFYHSWPSDAVLIVDNTNTSEAECAPYARLALAFGAELEVITVECPQEVAFARQSHGVPEKNHKSMFERLQRSRLPKEWLQRVVKTS